MATPPLSVSDWLMSAPTPPGPTGNSSSSSSSDDELERLRRCRKTEKARFASLVARKKKRQATPEAELNWERQFAVDFFSKDGSLLSSTDTSTSSSEIRKNLYIAISLYLLPFVQCFVTALDRMVAIHHVLSCTTFDDTDICLSYTRDERRSKIPIMNCLQDCHIRYDNNKCLSIFVPQPFMVLFGGTAQSLYDRWRSWLLFGFDDFGHIFKQWGTLLRLFRVIPILVHVLTTDALKANTSLFRKVGDDIVAKNSQNILPLLAAIQFLCVIHQLALARKEACLCVPGYWSSVVRLSHLFESHAWRAKFRNAVSLVIASDFKVFYVAELPQEVQGWMEIRRVMYNLPGSSHARKKHELDSVELIISLDNGNPYSTTFMVYTTEKLTESQIFQKLVSAYWSRFAQGYTKPLLYRWKHADKAQRYLNDVRP